MRGFQHEQGAAAGKTCFEACYLTDDKFAAPGRPPGGAEARQRVPVAVGRFLLYTGPQVRGAAAQVGIG